LLVLAVIALVVAWQSDGSLMAACYAFVLLLLPRFSLVPEWLVGIAMWNPVSSTADAVRELQPGTDWWQLDRAECVAHGRGLADPRHRRLPAVDHQDVSTAVLVKRPARGRRLGAHRLSASG
jgi:hypothetical protein